MTTPPPTITGLPRSPGSSRCSTDAKKASRSAWRIVAAPDTNACSHTARRLLHYQGALHTGGRVARHGPEEGVAARFERGGERGRAAVLNDRSLALDGAFDRDVVRNRRLIRHRDRDLARARARLAELERERPGRVGGDRELAALL